VQCRASAGECDLAESCTGASAACPADTKAPAGTECTDDGNVCTVDRCDGTSNSCQHLAGNAGVQCRASAGECDLAESCTGASAACPADTKAPAGTECTDDGNVCTVDRCDGTSNSCQHPAGNAGVQCRASSGAACDAPDFCTGTSTSCVDTFQ